MRRLCLNIFLLLLLTSCSSPESRLVDQAYNGDLEAVKSALSKGISPDAKSTVGMTALMAAARNNHLQVMEALIQAGANVDARDSNGWTPLMTAAYRGHTAAVKLLIEAGAILDIRNNEGKTAVDLSVDREDRETLTYFYEVIGTKPNTTPANVETRVQGLQDK